jgi:hypothetical protein
MVAQQQSTVEKEKVEEITPAEYARRGKTTIAFVYTQLWANRLVGRKVDGRWLITVKPK